jgi:hypothetical protein
MRSVSQAWRIERGDGTRRRSAKNVDCDTSRTRQADWIECDSATITPTASTRFWGHRLLQQLDRALRSGEVGLELGDPLAGSDELLVVGAVHAIAAAGIDQVLVPPVVNRLTGDTQIGCDLSY